MNQGALAMKTSEEDVPFTIMIEEIKQLIPHRYPLLLVDRVVDVRLGESAVGIKNVSVNEEIFQGHFPQKAIFPGVLIIEAMAQTAAVLVMKSMGDDLQNKLVYFMSIEEAKFRKPVVPGDRLEMQVERVQGRGRVWKFQGVARVEDITVAEAVFTAMIVDNV